MSLLDLFVYVVLISSSGALSPGPLTIATIRYSLDYGKRAGFLVSFGHMVFELPLVLAISVGVISFINDPLLKFSIGLAGSIALIFFGLIEVRSFIKYWRRVDDSTGSMIEDVKDRRFSLVSKRGFFQAIIVGFIFTSLNPYFIIWWMSVGLTLIVSFLAYASLTGILIMYLFHIWIDYAWLGFISYVTYSGKRFLKTFYIKIISLVLSIIIILLGVYLLTSVVSEFLALRSP